MPLARIDLTQGQSAEYRQAIGEVVYDAMVEILQVPEEIVFRSSPNIQRRTSSLTPTTWASTDRRTACSSS